MDIKHPIKILNFINNEFYESKSYFNSYNPSTGEVNALIPSSGHDDVNQAVDAAKSAFNSWSMTCVPDRVKYLYKIGDLIDHYSNELALAESNDQGKPLWLAQTVDIPRASFNFRHFAATIQSHTESCIVQPESGLINYVTHEPVGVAGIITPWNLPLYLLTFKLAPAIAYGNTVVAKPSELTSVTAFLLCKIIKEANLPPGVINIVFGKGKDVGQPIVIHPDVPLISFTGGTVTGRQISTIAGSYFKKLSLEMGGKNPAIIFSDVDLKKHMNSIVRSCFFNQGEICLATSRIYVEKSIYQKFVDEFIEESLKLKVGDPLDKDTFIGALISKEHLEKVLGYVEIGKKEGVVKTGEFKLLEKNKKGYFCPISIITQLNDDSKCMKEEIFGPVVCVTSFETEDEVIKRANNSCYGLSGTIWSSSVDKIHRVANKLKVGTVWCNCWLVRNLNMPFGGMKQSGSGREGTFDSKEFYTEKKTICIKTEV